MRSTTMILALVGTVVLAKVPSAQTMRNNEVFFDVTGVEDFSFAYGEHHIRGEQPWGGVSANISRPGQGRITVRAGRKGSEGVARWFAERVGGGQTLVCNSRGNLPDKLNFATKGTLRFRVGGRNYTCPNFILGQGNYLSANNWWIGSPNMRGTRVSFTGGTVQLCRASGLPVPAPVTFTPQTPCSNHFNIGVLAP